MDNPQLVFSWKAPLRPYKKQSPLILRFYLSVALLLSLIVFFFGDKILLLPIWAVLALFYILTVTPPAEVENKITKFGIESAGITLRWDSLSHFYFSQRFGFYVLTVVGAAPYLFHVYMVVPDDTIKSQVVSFLSDHLVYKEKPERAITEKLADLLSRLIPDEEQGPPSVSSTRQAVPL